MDPAQVILVVDDDEDIRTMLRWVLEASGYRVACAADGLAALEYLRAHPVPSLALVDLMMPNMDGETFLNQIRQDPALAQLPVLILSGQQAACDSAAAMSATGCLAKPVDLDDLLTAVQRAAAPVPV